MKICNDYHLEIGEENDETRFRCKEIKNFSVEHNGPNGPTQFYNKVSPSIFLQLSPSPSLSLHEK